MQKKIEKRIVRKNVVGNRITLYWQSEMTIMTLHAECNGDKGIETETKHSSVTSHARLAFRGQLLQILQNHQKYLR